jgi:hypothetical protein
MIPLTVQALGICLVIASVAFATGYKVGGMK